jgi:beta-glucosidase
VPPISPGLKSKHNHAKAIVADMTLEEKARLCSGRNFWHMEGLERFDLPSVMVTDGPHGLRKQQRTADHVGLNKSVPATCFPTACALAASWDVDLLRDIGTALGEQCLAEHVTVLLGPGMNIKRHPLCGRNFEYFSEDPLVTGTIAAALVQGVQSQGVGTSIKHFAVNNQEHARMFIDAIVDERTLREIYLRGFEIAVKQAQPWTVMCAYNRLNGTYCSEHDWLLNKILRDDWGFEGMVVTDWGATNDRVAGVAAGLDLEMPGSGGINDQLVKQAIETGVLAEQDLDRVVARNVSVSLLGADLHNTDHIADQQAHHELARRAASESAVLLKNEQNILPLSADGRLAVIGAFAKHPRYQGTGSSQVNPVQLDTAWQAIEAFVDASQLVYAPGYDPKHSDLDQALIDEAVAAATEAEVTVLFAGLPNVYESEGFDRSHMSLPEQHDRLIEAVCAANPKTIVVLSNGSPVAMPWVDQPMAILEAYLAGQAGGTATADLLFGICNPSGKLAETFQLGVDDAPASANFPGEHRQVQYREGLYVGYRYFDSAAAAVLFPFGHGLSYTTFEYANLTTKGLEYQQGTSLTVNLDITNTGQLPGAEVVQLYVHTPVSRVYRPLQELRGFCKVQLDPGETKSVSFCLDDAAFAYFDQGHADWTVESGNYEIRVGSSSRDIRCKLAIQVDSDHFVSEQAGNVSGPDLDETFNVDDQTFAAMLGSDIPAPESSRPFHENSSLLEVGETWLGGKFKARVVEEFKQTMGGDSSNETLNKMFEEMANNMPLRALALFSGGSLTMAQIRMVIAILNHRYIRALKLWLQR